jgi:hypothetical protein
MVVFIKNNLYGCISKYNYIVCVISGIDSTIDQAKRVQIKDIVVFIKEDCSVFL